MPHAYSIIQLIEWLREGMTWYVLSLTPLRVLVTVPQQPPGWWFRWYSYGDWYNNSDDGWHPYPYLAWLYLQGVFRLLDEFIIESATWIANQAYTILRALIGSLPQWAGTVAHGLDAIFDRIGSGALMWASNILLGLQRIYDWLPNEIKLVGMSWSTLFEFVKSSVKTWAISYVADALNKISQAWTWLTSAGVALTIFYNSYAARIQAWLEHPAAMIVAAIGPDLNQALVLAHDAGAWLYALWAQYAATLGEFLADPGRWTMNKIVAEIKRVW